MKFDYCIFRIYLDWITLITTVELHFNNYEDDFISFRVEVHFICFHLSALWFKEGEI